MESFVNTVDQHSGAMIIPFPLLRRRRFIVGHARRLSRLPHGQAERHLAWQLRAQARTMLRKGIAPDRVDRETMHLEVAIRAALKQFTREPDSAA